jgi:hypothetical protein
LLVVAMVAALLIDGADALAFCSLGGWNCRESNPDYTSWCSQSEANCESCDSVKSVWCTARLSNPGQCHWSSACLPTTYMMSSWCDNNEAYVVVFTATRVHALHPRGL